NKNQYQDFKNFFVLTYLNNNSNIDFKESMLDKYKDLKKYSFLNYELDNNTSYIIPNNDGFISGIFLISFGLVSLIIYLSIVLKLHIKRNKKKKK
ncbi:MAG: hypothetical protein K2I76_02360, partial [Malacoplasma sp.]|nr:hypothetical protein [Malacoplasma sp.]